MRVSSNSVMTDAQGAVFGAELRRLRKKEGLTLAAFGELVGSSATHISALEGGSKKPSPQLAERIADAFGVKVEDMLVSNDDRVWEIRKKYGKTIREHRLKRNLSEVVVANALGVPLAVYKEYEQGLASITDREINLLDRLLGISEKPEVVEKVVTVPAEIPAEIYDIILKHIKDLQIGEDEQKRVWRYFNEVRMTAEERRLFG